MSAALCFDCGHVGRGEGLEPAAREIGAQDCADQYPIAGDGLSAAALAAKAGVGMADSLGAFKAHRAQA